MWLICGRAYAATSVRCPFPFDIFIELFKHDHLTAVLKMRRRRLCLLRVMRGALIDSWHTMLPYLEYLLIFDVDMLPQSLRSPQSSEIQGMFCPGTMTPTVCVVGSGRARVPQPLDEVPDGQVGLRVGA